MNEQIKKSVDSIKIDRALKDNIYNNIIEKSKKEEKKVYKVNFKKYIPLVACLVLAIGYFTFFGMQNNVQTQNLNVVRTVQENPVVESTKNYTFYMPSESGVEEYVLENCPQDLSYAINELKVLEFFPKELEISSFIVDENKIEIELAKEIELYTQNTDEFISMLKISAEEIYPDFEINITIENDN